MIANKIFFVAALFFLLGCATDPVTNRYIVTMGQSLAEDEQIGEKNSLKVVPSNTRVRFDDPRAVRVQEVYYKLFDQTEFKGKMLYVRKISLMEKNTPNALAFGGGYVVLTTGMLSAVKNDDQLAAVVAHELAHNTHRHVAQNEAGNKLETIVSIVGPILVAAAGGDMQTYTTNENIRKSFDPLFKNAYSRDQEREADKTSIIYMCKAGFDPSEAIKLHRDILPTAKSSWDSSHPSTSERMDLLQNTIQSTPECSSFERKQ